MLKERIGHAAKLRLQWKSPLSRGGGLWSIMFSVRKGRLKPNVIKYSIILFVLG